MLVRVKPKLDLVVQVTDIIQISYCDLKGFNWRSFSHCQLLEKIYKKFKFLFSQFYPSYILI